MSDLRLSQDEEIAVLRIRLVQADLASDFDLAHRIAHSIRGLGFPCDWPPYAKHPKGGLLARVHTLDGWVNEISVNVPPPHTFRRPMRRRLRGLFLDPGLPTRLDQTEERVYEQRGSPFDPKLHARVLEYEEQ